MAPGRLKLVRILQPPAEAEVARKYPEDESTFFGWVRVDNTEEREGTKEEGK